ncbi:hypothetical protein [Tahibacter amnicola]|uniref:Peptidase C-terminal archaeal/bacterial domain-containing protein n=1 Tax=Tahibacter amnicola TaxID=2976241 RepID=A0ABY6BA57_9GAMM|nr:hypothetical protein [Tahibacter amnicola]UXI66948.1 hypothetical protein N4264_19650 [Tahibacter amnicola]
MKKNAFLLAAGLLTLGMGAAHAQSCASPSIIPLVGGTNHVINGVDGCAGANQLGTLCGSFNSPENDVVFSFNIDGTRTATTFTLSTSTPAWDPAMLLMSGSCGGGATCTDVAANNGAGANETMAVPTGNGLYYLVVTSSPGTGSCGTFSLDAGGRLPVALQKFSVE